MERKKSGKGAAVIGAGVVGFLIGAAVAVFGMPKTGEKNRKDFLELDAADVQRPQ